MIRKAPKTQAAPGVVNKPPQTPDSQENGEQFGELLEEIAGISRAARAADVLISRHDGLATGELITPPGEDGEDGADELDAAQRSALKLACVAEGVSPMRTPNEFWLCLHELSTAKDAEGATAAERQANIVNCFRKMPPLARQQSLDELMDLEIALQELFPLLLGPSEREYREPVHGQRSA